MRVFKILDKETGQLLIGMHEPLNIESVNPIKYFEELFIFRRLVLEGVSSEELNLKVKPSVKSMKIFDAAVLAWKKKLLEINNTHVPFYLINLLESENKKEQVRLLKGIELSPSVLLALLFEAYSKHGFKYSQYRTEVLPEEIDGKNMPFAAEILENGELKVWGETEMSEGQIRHAIKFRSVNVGNFLEKGNKWHCFFGNYRSLFGEETWSGNHPHYHYISNYFGLTREIVIQELKSKQYKLGNLPHIKLMDYPNK